MAPKKFFFRRRNSPETKNSRMALQGRVKINWKISECGKPQLNMRATRKVSKRKKKVREKSLKSLLLWHAIVKRPFFFFAHPTKPEAMCGGGMGGFLG
jgi:hypothetical protein